MPGFAPAHGARYSDQRTVLHAEKSSYPRETSQSNNPGSTLRSAKMRRFTERCPTAAIVSSDGAPSHTSFRPAFRATLAEAGLVDKTLAITGTAGPASRAAATALEATSDAKPRPQPCGAKRYPRFQNGSAPGDSKRCTPPTPRNSPGRSSGSAWCGPWRTTQFESPCATQPSRNISTSSSVFLGSVVRPPGMCAQVRASLATANISGQSPRVGTPRSIIEDLGSALMLVPTYPPSLPIWAHGNGSARSVTYMRPRYFEQ